MNSEGQNNYLTDKAILETRIDHLFDSCELLREPFCVLFNILSQILAISEVDHIADCTVFMFEKLKDFNALTESECWERCKSISIPAWSTAYQCATLNQIYPLIHRDIYSLDSSEAETLIKYSSEHIGLMELRDEVITRLSMPLIAFGKHGHDEFYRGVVRRLDRNEKPNILKGITSITKFYKRMPMEFDQEELICAPVFKLLGFSGKNAFYNIRNAFFAVSEALIRARHAVGKYIKIRGIDEGSAQGENLLRGLSMVVIDERDLKTTIISICKASEEDYDNFCRFFMHQPSVGEKLSSTCMPALWNLSGWVYFSPFMLIKLLFPRNLLMITKNNKNLNRIYSYDSHVSCHLEPNLIGRANKIFLGAGFQACSEKKFGQSEIDLLVYCKRSNTILIVQAKATLPPNGGREVDRLDSRINEAKKQLDVFLGLQFENKIVVASECFPNAALSKETKFILGILVNSSFGSYRSWDLMSKSNIMPINCHILKNTIGMSTDLLNLHGIIWNYIETIVEKCQPRLEEKCFEHSELKLRQEKWEFDIPHSHSPL